mgnify:CR=1 FL=1
MAEAITLSRYNVHKRKTLDRVTNKHTRQYRNIVKSINKSIEKAFFEALERGDKSFNFNFTDKENEAIEDVFKKHRFDTVFVSVADGMQEVPVDEDESLNAWATYPLDYPIEKTLQSLKLKEAKTLADRIDERIGNRRPKFFQELIGSSKKMILRQIRGAYNFSAKNWLEGKSTIAEVKASLAESLDRSTWGIERVFRTETTRYFNEARVDYFKETKTVTHYQIFAITDGRISDICNSRHGFVFESHTRHKKFHPPFHPNCRTILRPLLEKLSRHKKIIKDGMAMDQRKFKDLPKGWV